MLNNEESLTRIKGFLNTYDHFLLVSHIQPDGDAISSLLSLGFALRRLGKKSQMAIDSVIPDVFHSIPLIDQIQSFPTLQPFDAVVFLDGSSLDRMGRYAQYMEEKPNYVIDHHPTNTRFAKELWLDPAAAATAQMVLRLNRSMNVPYDPILATINLLGIQTDSGFFRYSNTTANLLRDAATLVEWGAQPYFNSSMILENKKPEEFHLLTKMIQEIKTLLAGKLVYSSITQKMLQSTGCAEEDTAGFIGELRSIKGSECTILFVETEEATTRVSFRSKRWYDVSKIALSFGGGGHIRASGCTLKEGIDRAIEKVISQVQIEMTQKEENIKFQNLLLAKG